MVIKIHLSRLLGERKMTQADLARRTKIRPSTINAYYHEYVERIRKSDLDKICAALNCRIEDLIKLYTR